MTKSLKLSQIDPSTGFNVMARGCTVRRAKAESQCAIAYYVRDAL